MTDWQTMTLDERIVSITSGERHPRFRTYRDQLPTDVSDNTIYRHLRQLVKSGILTSHGVSKSRYWTTGSTPISEDPVEDRTYNNSENPVVKLMQSLQDDMDRMENEGGGNRGT